MYLKVRSGVVTESNVSMSSDTDAAHVEVERLNKALMSQSIQDIKDYSLVLTQQVGHVSKSCIAGISPWLNAVFGKSG